MLEGRSGHGDEDRRGSGAVQDLDQRGQRRRLQMRPGGGSNHSASRRTKLALNAFDMRSTNVS
jgi:hypothetical protein